MSDKIVAQVNGKKISQEDVVRFVEEIGPEVAMQFQSPDGIKKIIEEMVAQELLLIDAKENDLDKEEEFIQTLEHTKNNLLKSYSFSKVVSQAQVTDEEVKDLFEENKEKFAKDSVKASHILVDSKEKAEDIISEIEAGKSFEDAAKEYSSCPSAEEGGRLGEFSRGQMVKEFEDVAFSQEINQISEPVKSQFGYHIILTTERNSPEDVELSDVEEAVRSEALRLKQLELYQKKINQLKILYEYEIFE